MARLDAPHDDYRHGSLIVEPQSSTKCIHVFYIPSVQRLEQSDLKVDNASEYRVKLLEINSTKGRLTIFPINTLGGHANFLKPKYKQVERITLAGGTRVLSPVDDSLWSPYEFSESLTFGPTELIEGKVDKTDIAPTPQSSEEIQMILESLPSGFTKDYDYGLGLAKEYRFIVEAVEELTDCKEILISREHETAWNQGEQTFYLASDDFETMRKLLNSTNSLSQMAARSVKTAESYNFLADLIDQPQIPVKVGRHRLRKLFTSAVQTNPDKLSDDDQEEVLRVFSKGVRSLAEAKPEKLAKLRSDMELVNLEMLIGRYEAMMTSRHKEEIWQEFLSENLFILGLAFGYPIVLVEEQASVGGRRLSAKGEKLADFLVRNSMTTNTALIEIKTPQSSLLNKSQYREGVFTPSSDLSGSINQVLDQRYQFQREISLIKDKSKTYDISSYSVHCCLIIGTIPSDEEQQKSFELFRGNSKDVQIATFDELLQKLKNLKDFLETSELPNVETTPTVEVSF